MQFNLKENTDRQNELSSRFPKTIAIPYNAGREVALARKTRNAMFPMAPPANEVDLLEWINYWIEQGEIDTTSNSVSALNVSYIPTLPLVGTNVQVALQELTTLYNDLPVYTADNGLTLNVDTFKLGGILTENTLLEDVDPYSFTISTDTLSLVGKSTLRLQTPGVYGGTNALNRILRGISSIGNIEYSSFKIPATNGIAGQALVLDADNETLIWSNISTDTPDHGTLTGLADDDHPQYLNITRGDARYYTETEIDGFLATKANVSHTHAISDLVTTGTASGTTFLRGDGAWTALPVYTANNGLTLTGNNFSLGGTVTADDVTFNGDTNDIAFLNFGVFDAQASTLMLSSTNSSIQGTSSLKVITPAVVATTATVGQVLKLSNVNGTVEFANEAGGVPSSYTFTNGLTDVAGTVKLGGTLTDLLTTINGDANDLVFNEVANLTVLDSDVVSINSASIYLNTTSSLRLKTPAVTATTATVGQALKLTNATTGQVEFSNIVNSYLDLSDTPGAMGSFDVVPTVNNLSNALQHLPKNIMYTSVESYLDVSITALTNSMSFTTIPNDSVVLGGVAFQVVTGVITIDFNIGTTEKLTITALLDNTGNKYTLSNQFIKIFIKEDTPAATWKEATTKVYEAASNVEDFEISGGTLGVPKDYLYKILLTASA